jgi:hypothetical protein
MADDSWRDREVPGAVLRRQKVNLSGNRQLTPAAARALAEAEERRRAIILADAPESETGGPAGAEPTRYGDWERKGIAVDF